MGSCRNRSAFTLIELLIVIAVIGLLLAMLLPAAHAVRASMQQLSCAENLRTIGLAIASYTLVHDVLPAGGVDWPPIPSKRVSGHHYRQIAWSASILPYLDTVPSRRVSQLLNLDHAYDGPENSTAARQIVSTFICPAVRLDDPYIEGRAITHYGGIQGERITTPNNVTAGAMLYDRWFRTSDIKDGLSRTLLIGEDVRHPQMQWIYAGNCFDQAFRINHAPAIENDLRSKHVGGMNGLFADGGVRFFSEYGDLRILAAACTREGGETVDLISP